MMLDLCLKDLAHRVNGVLHVGAHTGQERDIYKKHGIERVVWVEANPELIEPLKAHVAPQPVIQAAVWSSHSNVMQLNISSNDGHSSSLFPAGTVKKVYPDIVWDEKRVAVTTTTLDKLAADHDLTGINMLVMDIQGAEAKALAGAWRFMRQIDYVFVELNFESVYVGCAHAHDVERELPGFTCTAFGDTQCGWGEAMYQRYRWSAMDFKARQWKLKPMENADAS